MQVFSIYINQSKFKILLLFFFSVVNFSCIPPKNLSESSKVITLGEKIHNGLQISLQRKIENPNLLYLRINQAGISYTNFKYLSNRIDPHLTNDISVITAQGDTVKPSSTMVEKGYEASNEIIYVILLNTIKVEIKFLFINNFLFQNDTLKVQTIRGS